MSFSTLRKYFEERMLTVDSDFREWEDAFNLENIPSTILDKSWHIRFQPFSFTGNAQTCMNFDCPVTLTVFLKGHRQPKEAIDTALVLADSIIKECTKPVLRLNQPAIKNVLPSVVDIRELAQSNDNAVVLEIQFNCEVIVDSKNT